MQPFFFFLKTTLICLGITLTATTWAERIEVYPTIPGTNLRDFTRPGTIYENDGHGRIVVQPTEPGMSIPSFSEPGAIVEQDGSGRTVVYPTYPGSRLRDFSQPGYVIEER